MKRYITILIRKKSWAVAALFLIVFCWLGFAAVSLGTLFKGLEMYLPLTNRLALVYGPIAFPILGIAAATAFILSDLWSGNRWVQVALGAFFALLIIWAVKGVILPVSVMVPTIRPMQ